MAATFPIDVVPALRVTSAFLLSAEQRQRGHLCTDEPVQVLVRAHCVAPPPVHLRLNSLTLEPALAAHKQVQSYNVATGSPTKEVAVGGLEPLLKPGERG